MKFLMYKVKTRKTDPKRRFAFNIEKFLFLAFVVTFIAMIIVQTALMSPSVRTSLSINDELEGTPLGTEEFLYAEGRLVLQLIDGEEDHNLKVLVNGDEVARFSDKKLEITVRDGDVIEIDGSDVQDDVKVGVIFKSENILTDCLNKAVIVNSCVRRFMKVRLK